MYKIIEVKALSDYNVWVKFYDGTEGTVNLSYLAGKGVFSLWNNYEEFKKVAIGSSGELLWGDTVDVCPDTLYMKVSGKEIQELFPGIKHGAVHA